MEYNRYRPMSSFYLFDLIGIPVTSAYVKSAKDKELKEISDSLYSALASTLPEKEKFLDPVAVFHNDVLLTARKLGDSITNQYDNQFYVSLGIFDLDTNSATVTITKNNKLEVTWTERAGKGRFTSKIPSYLIPTSAPVLSYEGGVLDIRVPVESRSKNDTLFVGKLSESKS